MTARITRSHERGTSDLGWLQSRFSFSFAEYRNPNRMGFGALRVINDDRIAPSSGFDTHFHRDFEIVTVVTKGAVTHADSMGHSFTLEADEVQHMSAGSGVEHSEHNRDPEAWLELFQIWFYPAQTGITPAYQNKRFDPKLRHNRLALLVSPDEAEGSLPIAQDVRLYRGTYDHDTTLTYTPQGEGQRGIYLLVIDGRAETLGETLRKRDAIEAGDIRELSVTLTAGTDILLFDVPFR